MDSTKRGCDTEVDSVPHDVNDTPYNEDPAKYMANPLKGFWLAIKKFLAI